MEIINQNYPQPDKPFETTRYNVYRLELKETNLGLENVALSLVSAHQYEQRKGTVYICSRRAGKSIQYERWWNCSFLEEPKLPTLVSQDKVYKIDKLSWNEWERIVETTMPPDDPILDVEERSNLTIRTPRDWAEEILDRARKLEVKWPEWCSWYKTHGKQESSEQTNSLPEFTSRYSQ